MSLAYVGPIAVTFHGDPSFSWSADPAARGQRGCSIGGYLEWAQGKQLQELVDNPTRLVTIGEASGVVEPIWPDDALLAEFRGWYLLQRCELTPTYEDSGYEAPIPFTLAATRVPDSMIPAATRSARARSNDYGISPAALVATPFRHDDIEGGDFLVSPGGSRFTREYDASSPHDSSRVVPAAEMARSLAIRSGGLAPVDVLAKVAVPTIDDGGPGVPAWVRDRGGDCRAYDRRSMREVYGSTHPFAASTDCILTNGVLRARVGNRGLPPYLHLEAIADGAWRQAGVLEFGSGEMLTAPRLVQVTPDLATVALSIRRRGEVFVTLKRGERMLRGSSSSTSLVPRWSGMPPTSRANQAANAVGRFGNGLDGGGDDATWDDSLAAWDDLRYTWDGGRIQPDVRLLWPPDVSTSDWADVFWWRPNKAAADLAGAGLLSIYDEHGARSAEVFLDDADLKIKFKVGAATVASSVQTFDAGDDLCIGVRFSADEGMALSVRAPAGDVEHVANPAATTPGTTGSHYDHAYLTNPSDFGDGDFGDDVFGGVTSYPDGVIDNHMRFDGWISDAEFAALAAAEQLLDGLPAPEARLVWHAPFDVVPIPTFASESTGLQPDTIVDAWGFQRGLAYLDAGRTSWAALLGRDALHDTLAEQHRQFAAESEQRTRVAMRSR